MKDKIDRHEVSVLFNQTCLKEKMLPTHTHTHTHTHIHTHTHTHVCNNILVDIFLFFEYTNIFELNSLLYLSTFLSLSQTRFHIKLKFKMLNTLYIYLSTPPHKQKVTQGQFFNKEPNGFALLFTHSLRENS